jgi:iron complex outermembrane receptor protein
MIDRHGAGRLTIALVAMTLSSTAWATAASADDQASSPDASSSQTGREKALEDIVVTAERRTVNIQKVAAAVTAVSGSQLASKAVARAEDLVNISPSLSVSDTGVTQNINIRGIGIASISPNVVSGVAKYTDGIFEGQILTGNIYYDIASIEVLRGPQGTLVGSNSTGGAIFVKSKDPSLSDMGGYLMAGAGNYSARDFQGALNIPVTSTLAVRFAGNLRDRDSFSRDVGPFKSSAGSLNEKDGRIGLLWKTGSFQLLNKAEWVDRRTDGFAFRPTPGTLYSPGAVGDIYTLSYNSPTFRKENSFQESLELKYTFDDGTVLRSQSGYQFRRFSFASDVDATQLDLLTELQFAKERQYSQEINLISPSENRFTYIAGGYFQRNQIRVSYTSANNGFPVTVLFYPKKTNFGIFGQIGYKFSPKLSVDLGLRYSGYKASARGGGVFVGAGVPDFPAEGQLVASTEGDHKDGRVTGKLAVNFTPDDSNLIYAFVARGYKSGGFNSPTSGFKPETVINYELGWKTEFLDRRVRLQFDVFYNTYNDFQYDDVERATGQVLTFNLKDATIKGFEAQFQTRFGGFGLDGSVAYVDSKLARVSIVNTLLLPPGTAVPQCATGQEADGTCFNYEPFVRTNNGGRNLYSPKWSINGGIEYRMDVADWSITPRMNIAYVSSQFTNLAYSSVTDLLPARTLVSSTLTIANEKNTFDFFVTNLTKEKYVSGQGFYPGNRNNFYGAPREYGVRFTRQF